MTFGGRQATQSTLITALTAALSCPDFRHCVEASRRRSLQAQRLCAGLSKLMNTETKRKLIEPKGENVRPSQRAPGPIGADWVDFCSGRFFGLLLRRQLLC